jgi:hypothetical protein
MISALPMQSAISMTPDADLDRPLYGTRVEWTWPEEGDWTHFRLVRRLNSPARRCEEGAVLLETTRQAWGDPVYEDLGAPPGRWAYYTAFVLTLTRIWTAVGSTYDMGTNDHDWTVNLPELLPGVAVSRDQQVVARADANSQLVEFLQGPGLVLDRVVSYAESMQYFWDPLRVPPSMLSALLQSLGLDRDDTLTDARLREVAHALLVARPQGALDTIRVFASAVTGYPTQVRESHNRMLSVIDSSFEATTNIAENMGTYAEMLAYVTYQQLLNTVPQYLAVESTTHSYKVVTLAWANYDDLMQGVAPFYAFSFATGPPAGTINSYRALSHFGRSKDVHFLAQSNWAPLDPKTMELRRYEYYPTPPKAIPVETLGTFFLHTDQGVTLTCGEDEPMLKGIPVSWWNAARGGVFARSSGTAELEMRLQLYDLDETLLRTVTLVPRTTLTRDWQWLHTEEDQPQFLNEVQETLLVNPATWEWTWADKAEPQTAPTVVPPRPTGPQVDHLLFSWNDDPDPAGDIDNQPPTAAMLRPVTLYGHEVVTFSWEMAGTAHPVVTNMTPWRLVIAWETGTPAMTNWEHSSWIAPNKDTVIADLVWRPQSGLAQAWFGIEVMRPDLRLNTYLRVTQDHASYQALSGAFADYDGLIKDPTRNGWTIPTQHLAVHAEIRSGTTGRAYWAVPVLEVTGEADIDLVVVDDV